MKEAINCVETELYNMQWAAADESDKNDNTRYDSNLVVK